jgi:hypothetical protein
VDPDLEKDPETDTDPCLDLFHDPFPDADPERIRMQIRIRIRIQIQIRTWIQIRIRTWIRTQIQKRIMKLCAGSAGLNVSGNVLHPSYRKRTRRGIHDG